MPTCPVCEHVQPAGDECEVCGKKLTGPGTEAARVEPLPGLEPTLQAAVEVPADPVPDLEPTLQPAAEAPPGEVADWAEPTRAAAADPGPVEPLPGIERHEPEPLPDDGGGLDPLAPVVCRYCRSTAMPGDRFCVTCGMRLQRFDPVRIAALERGELVCRDCGSMGPGPRCRRCGARMGEPV